MDKKNIQKSLNYIKNAMEETKYGIISDSYERKDNFTTFKVKNPIKNKTRIEKEFVKKTNEVFTKTIVLTEVIQEGNVKNKLKQSGLKQFNKRAFLLTKIYKNV